MKITVVGAGAIGGFLACQFSESGHEVSIIARGETLQPSAEIGCNCTRATCC
ncbi:ketopantoate reductase family protein [Pseudomonas mandelii]|uniref:ketopantoate reductase family protein n=1 Tax=Pseudomonas mandelii TaxID=75612 RepID=UPI0021CC9347|nr:2-dehydropantoate 2-reductase N-terminal domain-containing protein [Pseudomonas mandelii]